MDDDCALVESVARCHSQLRLHALYSPPWVYTSEPENRVRKTYPKHTSGLATRKVQLLRSLMRCTHHLCLTELLAAAAAGVLRRFRGFRAVCSAGPGEGVAAAALRRFRRFGAALRATSALAFSRYSAR